MEVVLSPSHENFKKKEKEAGIKFVKSAPCFQLSLVFPLFLRHFFFTLYVFQKLWFVWGFFSLLESSVQLHGQFLMVYTLFNVVQSINGTDVNVLRLWKLKIKYFKIRD